MALVHISDVKIFNNPAQFSDPFQFQITFNSVTRLPAVTSDINNANTLALCNISPARLSRTIVTNTINFLAGKALKNSCILQNYPGIKTSRPEFPHLTHLDPGSDIEWSLVYVGSANDKIHDQILESVEVGPIGSGTLTFVLDAPAPDMNKIPKDELFGVTILLLKGTYRNQEFVRVGYYLKVDYKDEEYQAFLREWDEKIKTLRVAGEEDVEMADDEEEEEEDEEYEEDDIIEHDDVNMSDLDTEEPKQDVAPKPPQEPKQTPKEKPAKENITVVDALPTDPRLNPRNWPNYDINKVTREILMIIPPRVTYFTIVWDDVVKK